MLIKNGKYFVLSNVDIHSQFYIFQREEEETDNMFIYNIYIHQRQFWLIKMHRTTAPKN